jgi:hypothetical protein
MLHLIHGYAVSQLIYIAARWSLPDHIGRGVQTADALARLTGAQPGPLARVLRGLANIGVLTEEADGSYRLTPLGATLQTAVPGSMAGLAIIHGEVFYPAWSRLNDALRTGSNPFEQQFGTDFFSHLAERPQLDTIFNEFMVRLAVPTARALLQTYDFSSARRIVDVGGGYGTLLAPILAQTPQAVGVLFDTEAILAGTEYLFAAAGMGDRYEAVPGDFFEAVPPGDHYIVCQILHDWDDDQCRRILGNCLRAAQGARKLLVIERLLPERVTVPTEIVEYDLNMMVLGSGRERTETDYRTLLASAGWTTQRVTPLAQDKSLIEAVAADG